MDRETLVAQVSRRNAALPFGAGPGWACRSGDSASASFCDPESKQVSFDAKSATARFLISTPRKDRHGDVVLADGCQASLKDYEKNPVVFFGHDTGGLPIGSCKSDSGGCGIELADGGLYGSVKFHCKTRESEEVCALVEAGELRAASIGFIPTEALIHEREYDERKEGEPVKFEPFLSFTFTKWNLLEWSVVAVPANADALRCRLSRGLSGRSLSEPLARYLKNAIEPAPARRKLTPRQLVASAAGKVAQFGERLQGLKLKLDDERLRAAFDSAAKSVLVAETILADALKPEEPALKLVETKEVETTVVETTVPPEMTESQAAEILAVLRQVRDRADATRAELRRATGRLD